MILGGGIAGLWTLHTLTRAGLSAVLIESHALGAGQTGASQGIIHGGLKYALGGVSTTASRAIAEMPDIWRRCLSNPLPGDPDLRTARVHSPHQHLFTAPGVLARIGAAAGSLALRTKVERITRDAPSCPQPLRAAPRSVDLYQVEEPVLDISSLLEVFRNALGGRIIVTTSAESRGGWRLSELKVQSTCVKAALTGMTANVEVTARRAVLTAGAGNQHLLRELGIAPESCGYVLQHRPLHMVMLAGAPGRLFAHCIGASMTPRLTIITGDLQGIGPVWYIGGLLAEEGVARSEEDQIAVARQELGTCTPWLNFEPARMATCRWDRAEAAPLARGGRPGQRPDEPVIIESGPVLAAWPTKLAFAPLLAERLLERVASPGVSNRAQPSNPDDRAVLTRDRPGPPPVALPPWHGTWNENRRSADPTPVRWSR